MLHALNEPTDHALRNLVDECARNLVDTNGQALPPSATEALFQRTKRSWGRILNFYLPEKFGNATATQLSIALEMSIRLDLSTGRAYEPPPQMAGSRHWLSVEANPAHVDHREQTEMTWFLSKARCPIEILEPDFAFADIDTTLYKQLDETPWTRAWPLMIFGPEHVKRIGRDTLLDAPAWKIEELDYGGIWVQVWENPFTAPQKQVTTLAKYLDIPART